MMKRLSELTTGKKAVIRTFEPDEIHLKLMEMGCVSGEIIELGISAPLGDPISVKVAGYTLSLRKEEAAIIWVEEL